ncbi:MAG: hypothetical protein ACP5JG_04455 [Anaerolineae bacterium]
MRISTTMQRLLAVVLILTGVLIAACGGSSSGDGVEVAVDGATLLEERCTQCHGLDRVTSASKTEAEWQTTVEDMVQKGAQLNEQEKEALVAYLVDAYGP